MTLKFMVFSVGFFVDSKYDISYDIQLILHFNFQSFPSIILVMTLEFGKFFKARMIFDSIKSLVARSEKNLTARTKNNS